MGATVDHLTFAGVPSHATDGVPMVTFYVRGHNVDHTQDGSFNGMVTLAMGTPPYGGDPATIASGVLTKRAQVFEDMGAFMEDIVLTGGWTNPAHTEQQLVATCPGCAPTEHGGQLQMLPPERVMNWGACISGSFKTSVYGVYL